jgi:orotidine-5'-phosphate decarboxylase
MKALSKIALAIDFENADEIVQLLNSLAPKPQIIKLGLEVTLALEIERAFELIHSICPNAEIFLDLKLHDIPNTVTKSVKALVNKKLHNLKFLTVHALGGQEMVKGAVEAGKGKIEIVGVSVLTSHSIETINRDLKSNLEELDLKNLVVQLANVAVSAGGQWLVCSPKEIKTLKSKFPSLKLITPGVRPSFSEQNDQQRTMTPSEAVKEGSDILVIGRPITKSSNPQEAWKKILLEVENSLAE